MKGLLLGLLFLTAIPALSIFNYSPKHEILGSSFIEEAYAQDGLSPDEVYLKAVEVESPAEAIPDEEVKPYFEFFGSALGLLKKHFPKTATFIQASGEIIGSITTIFTLLTVFLLGLLKVPVIAARFTGAKEWEEKIQKFSDKVVYYAKVWSMFNAQKK